MAATVWAVLRVTLQVGEVPAQPPPLQPPNVEGGLGLAASVTVVLSGKSNAQVGPQLMPGGELVTVPVPVPPRLTISVFLPGRLKVAITDCTLLMVTVHVNELPEQPVPLQPPKTDGGTGMALSVTRVFSAKGYEQVAPYV